MRNMKAFFFLFSLATVLFALCPQRAAAQGSTTGDLTGAVTDPAGAVVPNVKVQLRSVEQGGTRETKTNDAGVYHFSLLQAGQYEVNIEAPGFQAQSNTTAVNLGQITTLDIKLTLGATTEKVVVIEEAPLVDTTSGNFATTLDERTIQNMPNQGNDMTYPLEMTAHVTENTIGGYGNYSVNGISATGNLFTINGMDDNDPYLSLNNTGATSLMLGQMEVQEATIVANGYGGQYAGLAGSNVNYITKGGSNQFHAKVVYYWNGRALDSFSFLNHAPGATRPFVNANQWGGEVGGPIKKDKLFWYFHNEGIRLIIPTAPSPVYVTDPAFEAATITNLTNIHPASVPFFQKAFTFYDGARTAHQSVLIPGNGTNNGCGGTVFPGVTNCVDTFTATGTVPTNEMQYSGRVDYNISSADHVFMHFETDHGFQGSYTDPINSIFDLVSNQPAYQGQLSENHTFGPNTTNQFILSGQWYSAAFTAANPAATYGAFPTSLDFLNGAVTPLDIANFNPNARNVTQVQISDDVTKIKGRNTIKFGMKYRRNDVTDGIYMSGNTGLMLIPDLPSFYNGGIVGAGTDETQFQQSFPSAPEQRFKFWNTGGYVEDDFQAKPNLTLTVSLRADHASNPTCKDLCFARLVEPFNQIINDPNLGGANAANIPYNKVLSLSNRTALTGLTNVEWAPRFGFAWQPFGRDRNTVIRGGIGIFWDTYPGTVVDNISENPPLFQNFTVKGGLISPAEGNSSLNAIAAQSNQAFLSGFTGGGTFSSISASLAPFGVTFAPPSINFSLPFTNVPQYQKWSLEIEHGFGSNDSVTISYTGNHGIHEPVQNEGLNAYSATGFGGLPTSAPDPRFAFANQINSEAVSNYNGISVSATHRYASGQISANYTYSHALDESSNGGFVPMAFQFFAASNTSPIYQQDPNNLRAMYGSADYDVRHYFSFNYLWELPIKRLTFGHGSDAALKGWTVSGTVLARTGLPFTVWDSATTGTLDGTNYGNPPSATSVVPEVFATLSGSALGNTCTKPTNVISPCMNLSGFEAAGTETGFGNVGRNSFRGPDYFNSDISFWKSIKVVPHWESAQLQLGVQVYNLFNHPNFDNPVADINNTGQFGHFTHTLSPATTLYGVALGADASMRIVQLKAQFSF